MAQRALAQYLIAYPHELDNFTQKDKEAVRDKIMRFSGFNESFGRGGCR
ncbi:hypothetical protein [Paenibacillus thiaminolyticus]|nr:hypothetical protein [Paenibacillus thiaminolyticus]WII35743.1 hypothetical protein O0V01_18870 [Paenibacillus thiaminolyticus]